MRGKCVKKAIEVDFIELRADNIKEVYSFIVGTEPTTNSNREQEYWLDYENSVISNGLKIKTLESGEGTQVAKVGIDIIIKGIDGECYPIKRDIWKKTYDIVK